MEVFLIIVTIIFAILTILVNIYLLAYYCHPDDKGLGTSGFAQGVVVFGLTLSWAIVLMLPLDVGNSRGDGDLDMKNFWYAMFMMIAIIIAVLIPCAIYFYESDEDDPFKRRLCWTIFQEICTLIISLAILFITWAFWRWADIPVQKVTKSVNYIEYSSYKIDANNLASQQTSSEGYLELEVSFPIYVMAMMSFVGWVFFCAFGGCGLVALPIDLIVAFKNRPKNSSAKEAANLRAALKQESEQLIKEGLELKDRSAEVENANGFFEKRKVKHNLQKDFTNFRSSVAELEKIHEVFKQELNLQDVNPFIFFGKLFFGVFFLCLSLMWWLHILIFIMIKVNGFPANSFLNRVLTGLEDSGVSFLATGFFILFDIYLLWCVIKGTFKFGVRIPFLFKFHPMKAHETWMNSFLFNTMVVLLSSVAVIEFSTNAFSEYTRGTDIETMFGVQIKYLRFFNYFYANNVFEIAFFSWSILAGLYFLCRPYDKPKYLEILEKRAKKEAELSPSKK